MTFVFIENFMKFKLRVIENIKNKNKKNQSLEENGQTGKYDTICFWFTTFQFNQEASIMK